MVVSGHAQLDKTLIFQNNWSHLGDFMLKLVIIILITDIYHCLLTVFSDNTLQVIY